MQQLVLLGTTLVFLYFKKEENDTTTGLIFLSVSYAPKYGKPYTQVGPCLMLGRTLHEGLGGVESYLSLSPSFGSPLW